MHCMLLVLNVDVVEKLITWRTRVVETFMFVLVAHGVHSCVRSSGDACQDQSLAVCSHLYLLKSRFAPPLAREKNPEKGLGLYLLNVSQL